MNETTWCIIDTETTGLRAPIFVVEIAAQRMRGWEPDGPPFRRLLNHGTDIPPEAARVHGYTREILERDGDEPRAVYRDFARYAQGLPVSAYNLDYDWDQVLMPEWHRLGVNIIGVRGLCLFHLAQRLLDPVPAGNCKLQTLRQYYGLPARGAHTALGDVETVIDLLRRVLRPLCEARGLQRFDAIAAFSQAPWFPARIPFGKYKGRHFREARDDPSLRSWLQWLAASDNPRSSAMGRWYFDRLDTATPEHDVVAAPSGTTLVIYLNPDVARLKKLIEQARNRLAELEAEYTAMRQAVAVTQSRLFQELQEDYRRRDILRVRLDMRRKYLESLLHEGEEEAQRYEQQRMEAEEDIHAEYQRTADETAGQHTLSEQEAQEVKLLWRKLVRLFHPDRFTAEPAKQAAYEHLTSEINRARDAGDINLLREIALDPEGYLARNGWGDIVIGEIEGSDALERLYESLQGQILELIDAIDAFRQSAEYELHGTITEQPELFEHVVEQYRSTLRQETQELEEVLSKVETELESWNVV